MVCLRVKCLLCVGSKIAWMSVTRKSPSYISPGKNNYKKNWRGYREEKINLFFIFLRPHPEIINGWWPIKMCAVQNKECEHQYTSVQTFNIILVRVTFSLPDPWDVRI